MREQKSELIVGAGVVLILVIMANILFTNNKQCLIDEDKREIVNKWRWHENSDGYAVTNILINGKHRCIRMHRLIMNAKPGEQIDHINGNRLDNRIFNLRICNSRQNAQNRKKKTGGTSIYKGVYWSSSKNKWCAMICINGIDVFIGYFLEERWAAMAYDIWAKDIFKQYANTNFRPPQ